MSEKTKAENMFEAKDPTSRFYEILSGCLEDMAEKKDYHGGLELIKFIRRFVPDVPVNEYRTVGKPESIIEFMELCGLNAGKDYKLEVSSLDPTSHVLSMVTSSAHTKTFLNHIAGFRVQEGPSVADRLYCELIKESGSRNFLNALGEGTCSKAVSVKKYIIDRTMEVYLALSKLDITKNGTPDEVKKIVEFAKSQISDGKLFQTSVPFVPLAAAELFVRVTDKTKNNSTFSCYPAMFELDDDPGSCIAARPIDIFSDKIPLITPMSAPVKILRKLSKRFDNYMSKDAESFMDAAGGNAAFVVVNSKVKFMRNTPEETLKAFNILRNRPKMMDYVARIYEKVYEGLHVTFDAKSDVFIPVSSKFIDKTTSSCIDGITDKTVAIENENGFVSSDEDPMFLLMSGFVIAPFESSQPVNTLYSYCSDSVSSVAIVDNTDECDSKMNTAETWFESIHGFKMPPTGTDSDLASLEGNIVKSNADAPTSTPAEKVMVAVATAIRTWIKGVQLSSYSETLRDLKITKTVDKADPNGLHSPNKYVTQVVTTVTGKTSKSISGYVRDTENGRHLMAPYVANGTGFSYDNDEEKRFVSSYLAIAVSTDMQVHNVKNVDSFTMALETNFDVDSIDMVRRSCSGTVTLWNRIRSEIIASLFSKEGADRLSGKIPEGGIINRTLDNIKDPDLNQDKIRDMIRISIRSDSNGRAVVMITMSPDIAFLAMAENCPEACLQDVINTANAYDSKLIMLPKDGWREKIAEKLITKSFVMGTSSRSCNNSKFDCMCKGIIETRLNIDSKFVGNYRTESMFNTGTCTKGFSCCYNGSSSAVSPD